MSAVEVTHSNIEQTIEQNGIVVLDFWASWCGPCMRFAPTFEAAAKANPDIVFGKINTEAEQQLAGEFQISSIPTLMIFRDKIQIFSQPGALPPAALDDIIRQVRALDMDDVRKKIAEHQAGHAS